MCDSGKKRFTDNRTNYYINFKFMDQYGKNIHYRVNVHVGMDEIKAAYSFKIGVPVEALCFIYKGQRVSDSTTPKKMGMREDDTIDVYQMQMGG